MSELTNHTVRRWPLALIAAPAAVAVWSGWVGLGELSGFGVVTPLPGIADGFQLNTAITLPVGVESYAAFALGAWLAPGAPEGAKNFAKRSAIGALVLGMAGQVAYHLLAASHAVRAPVPVVVLVSCLPVVVLGFAAALTHLLRGQAEEDDAVEAVPVVYAEATVPAAELTAGPSNQVRQVRQRRHRKRSNRAVLPDKASQDAAVLAALEEEPGLSRAALARATGLSERTVGRVMERLTGSAGPGS